MAMTPLTLTSSSTSKLIWSPVWFVPEDIVCISFIRIGVSAGNVFGLVGGVTALFGVTGVVVGTEESLNATHCIENIVRAKKSPTACFIDSDLRQSQDGGKFVCITFAYNFRHSNPE